MVDTLRTVGRRMVFWGGLVLALWALMDLFSQSALITAVIQGSTWRAYHEGALTLQQFIQYLPWNTLWIPLFLLGCVILGIVGMFTHRRAMAFALLAVMTSAALAVVLQTPRLFSWLGLDALWRIVNIIKLSPGAGGRAAHNCSIRYFTKRRSSCGRPPGRRFQIVRLVCLFCIRIFTAASTAICVFR